MGEQLTLRLPSAIRRRRLQSAQKALVMEVMKDTLPRKPGTRKFFATSPLGSCSSNKALSLQRAQIRLHNRLPMQCTHAVDVYSEIMDTLWVATQTLRSELQGRKQPRCLLIVRRLRHREDTLSVRFT